MKLPRLIALTPGELERGRFPAFLERLSRALDAGLPGLLVREPRLTDRDWLELAGAVRARGADQLWVGVHDRAHLARAVEADALHLGFRSLPPRLARRVVREEVPLGLSTHAGDDARTWAEADYLFHGPVKDTPSKAGRLAPVGFDGLASAVAATDRPILALGGMLATDVAPALRAGAYGVAVRAGILGRADADAAVRGFLEALDTPLRAR